MRRRYRRYSSSTYYEKVESRTFAGLDGEPVTMSWITLESGRKITFSDALAEAQTGKNKIWRWMARAVNLVGEGGKDITEYHEEEIASFLEDLELFVEIHRQEQQKRTGWAKEEQRIRSLEAKAASTTFEGEAESLRQKASELRARLEQDKT